MRIEDVDWWAIFHIAGRLPLLTTLELRIPFYRGLDYLEEEELVWQLWRTLIECFRSERNVAKSGSGEAEFRTGQIATVRSGLDWHARHPSYLEIWQSTTN